MFLARIMVGLVVIAGFAGAGVLAQQTFSFTTSQSRFVTGSNNQGDYSNDNGTFAHDEFGISDAYAVGTIAGVEYRDFLSFDVRGLNLTGQQITNATLSVPRFNYLTDSSNPTASRTLNLYDVTAGASSLKATRGSGDAASAFGTYFGDLGTGNTYGAFTILNPSNPNSTDPVVLTLNSTAYSDIANRVSSNAFFSVGGALSTLPNDFNDAIFANSAGGQVTLNVTLSPVPAPPGVVSALLGFGLAGWSARRRLRRS